MCPFPKCCAVAGCVRVAFFILTAPVKFLRQHVINMSSVPGFKAPTAGALIGNNFLYLENVPVEICGKSCLNMESCKSFDYMSDKRCYLSNAVIADGEVSSTGLYYEKKNWVSSASQEQGFCFGNYAASKTVNCTHVFGKFIILNDCVQYL